MKINLKKEKGVTLVSLSIAIIVILIITGMIIYNVKDNLKLEKLKSMQADIENLRDKVSTYYALYGKIPADTSIEYTNIEDIKNNGVISEAVDTGKFYVIDLAAMENVTLNYGKDYEKIRTAEVTTSEEINNLKDLYIINGSSHNIFYAAGIFLDGEVFYTNYTKEDIDTVPVNLRYVDGVKIPEGFYYVGGTKEEGIVISDSIEDINKGTSHEVAKTLNGNQFVWVPVENYEDFKRYKGYYNGMLQNIENYSEPSDNGYETEKVEYENMQKSVFNYGGFYVGRYEAGTNVKRTSVSGINDKVVIKQGSNPYNYIGWSDSSDTTAETGGALQKSKEFANENGYTSVTSTLIYGIQWDAIMQWLDPEYKNGNCDKITSFVANSTGKGNYTGTLNLTGENSEYVTKNIYDLAGNVSEWTMEFVNIDVYGNSNRVVRGGFYGDDTSKAPASLRDPDTVTEKNMANGFRIVLYLENEEKWSPTYDKTVNYKDKNGDTAVIPEGFQVSEAKGENMISEGLVVRGPDGSEFVWVPVDDINDMAQCETAGGNCDLKLMDEILKCTNPEHSSTAEKIVGKLWATSYGEEFGTVNTSYTPHSGLREPDIVSSYDNNKSYNNGLFTLDSLKADYKSMATSVAKNKGFYIGKYETSLTSATEISSGTEGYAQSKAGVIPTSANNTATNKWYGLYSISKTYTVEENSVQSSMIWGSQYDAMLNWVKNGNGPDKDKITQKGIGNNSGGLVSITGNSSYSNDSINNIRDLGGNLREWTLEALLTGLRVSRGGGYNVSNSPSFRYYGSPSYASSHGGTRLTLYIK